MRLISLIGEQPIPNLLPIRYYRPRKNLFVYTHHTRQVAARLRELITPGQGLEADLFLSDPYDLHGMTTALEPALSLADTNLFNLTGGTKIMSLAAFQVARKLNASAIYLASEGRTTKLLRYAFEEGEARLVDQRILPDLIDIDDYLLAHGLRRRAEAGPKNAQELGLRHWFESQVDECRTNLIFDAFEIDFILRRGNRVAIAEAKSTRENTRKGIDQLNTAGGRAYMGTYTGKLFLVQKPLGPQLKHLAAVCQINVVHVEGKTDRRTGRLLLTNKSQDDLRAALDSVLGPIH